MRLAVLTAVYPQAEPFLGDFRRSLLAQDDRDFDLYVLDDGLGRVAERFAGFAPRLRVVPASGTPGAIRKQGLRALAADGIEAVVFADSDDTCPPDRVAVSRDLLGSCRIMANELIAFGDGIEGRRPLLGHLLDERRELTWVDLVDGNVLGLSNTAAHVADLLPHLDAIDDRLLAFDWALFTRALYPRGRCRFTTRTATGYRQHGANSAGVLGVDAPSLLRSVRVKTAHYADLAGLDACFARLATGFARLLAAIESDTRQLAEYAAYAAEARPAFGPWWSAAPIPRGGFP
jgi:glycosyltransferase involved in cell wall biosynthesis